MIERLAYLVKTRLPGVFPAIAYAGRVVAVSRFSRRRAEALAEASIQGEVAGQRKDCHIGFGYMGFLLGTIGKS